MNRSTTGVWIGAGAFLVLVLAAALISTQYANAGGTSVTAMAIDMDSTGNTANSVGTTQNCGVIDSVGGTLVVDMILRGVPSPGTGGYAGDILFDPAVVKVTAFNTMMIDPIDNPTGSSGTLLSFSNGVPDTDGDWQFNEGTLGGTTRPVGDGVAIRVTLEAVGNGTSALELDDIPNGDGQPNVFDPDGTEYTLDTFTDGQIVVGGTCASTPTPVVTFSPTPIVTNTPTPTPTGPTPTPSPTGSPTPTESPTPEGQTPSPTPVPTPTPSPTPEGQTPSPTPEPTDTPTPTETPTETPTGSAEQELAGDTDCDGAVTSRDSQALLRNVLGQNPLSQTEPCPDPGTAVNGDDNLDTWGDWDCDGGVTTRDNQALLRNVLGQNPLSQTEVCPDIGTMTNI